MPVAQASTPFEAKLLAARLGADGVLAQVTGGPDGPYPVGPYAVLVEPEQAELARALLAATDHRDPDSGMTPGGDMEADAAPQAAWRRHRALVAAVVLALLVLFALARVLAMG